VNATGGTTNYSAIFEGGNVGVNTTAPAAGLDVATDLATRYSAFTAANGNNNNISIGASSFIRITGPTAPFVISGIAGGVDGKVLTLFNGTTQQITIDDESANSTAANRIWTFNSTGDIVILGKGVVKMIYSAADSRWIVISSTTSPSSSSTGIYYRQKYADETITNSTTLQNDNELSVPIAANDSMIIEGYLHISSNNTTSGFKCAFTIPTGAQMDITVQGTSSNTDDYEDDILTVSGTRCQQDYCVGQTTWVDQPMFIRGIVKTGSTAGNIQFQWASVNAAGAGKTTTVKAMSWVRGMLIRQ